VEELRLKSNEDLHKLWFVCVKEKNILLGDMAVMHKYDNSIRDGRLAKMRKTMNRILGVVKEREYIRKQYRQKLENEYIEKKKKEMKEALDKKGETPPPITWQMLRDKYLELRKGIDNVSYLERICNQNDTQGTKSSSPSLEGLGCSSG
jgi:large subunit ribosomal protein L47